MGEISIGDAPSTPLNITDHVCADCGADITYMDEVFLLQVVRPIRHDGRIVYYAVPNEQNPEEGFQFAPYYFCFRCWEKNYDEIREDTEDEPPIMDTLSQFDCVCCASGIREGELAGIFTLGEFRISERAPNGIRGAHFTPISNSDMLCIYCLTLLNEGYIDMWQNLSETYECTDCVQARCWRGPPFDEDPRITECGCRCHHGPPEDEEEHFTFPSFT